MPTLLTGLYPSEHGLIELELSGLHVSIDGATDDSSDERLGHDAAAGHRAGTGAR